ncbi:thioesterase family protein [Nonomuraea sp. NPDC050556]|uniref:thioesterase family protein n=1 Tax=Nonomuraea sp. NPDC050556 TaxID=3364369 RepID=UPI0037A79271
MQTFREATAVSPLGEAVLDGQWSVGGKLHGGYLLAILARAAVQRAEHPHLSAISGSFLEAPEPGPAQVDVVIMRRGRTVTQARATLSQQGAVKTEALVTLGELDDGDPWWTSSEPVDLPEEEACFLTPPDAPGGFRVPLMEVVEQRLDPAQIGFAFGQPSRKGVLSGWQRLADGSDWDPLSLLVALDPVPPVSYDLGLPGWVPTISLTAYIRRLPVPGSVRVSMSAADVTAGRMDETTSIWDAKGRLVAQATQLAAVRLPQPTP